MSMEKLPHISRLHGPGQEADKPSAPNLTTVEFVPDRGTGNSDQPSPFVPANSLPEESTPLLTSPAKDGRSVSPEEGEDMFRSIQAIFQEAVEDEGSFDVNELLASLELADEEARPGRQSTQTLKGVRGTLDAMWKRKSDYLARAAEALADGCRDRECFDMPWRLFLLWRLLTRRQLYGENLMAERESWTFSFTLLQREIYKTTFYCIPCD